MAAIFCNALLAPCKAIARCTEACCNGLTKACGACGGCCEDLCASVAKCCGSCCTALGNCCASCCATLQQCFSKPFSGVVFLTVLLSVVPFCAMIFAVIKFWSNQCSHPLQVWLLICLIVFLINLIFALYLFRRLAGTDFENPEINPRYDANKHEEINQYEHTKHFLMYDPGVCLYIMILLFQIAWAIVGLSWYGDEGTVCSDDARPLLQCVLAGSIILLVFVGIFLIGLMCSVYSGFITVCMNDWNILKCLFCWIYYPFIYNHARVREKYYGQHNRLQPRSPVANNNAAAARAGGQAQPIRGGNNPQAQYGIIPPAPQPQNMGGQVYYRPAQQPAQPVYNQAPVNYAAQQQPSPQYQQAAASPVYQQPLYQPSYQASPPPANIAPAQPRFQSQEELLAQYRPPQQQQPYQPPAQQFSPYHQPEPAQYQPASAAQVQFHVEPGHQVEGQPNPPAEEYHQAQPQAGMPHAPGGVASVGAPAAIPVAQPIAQPAGGGQRQPQEQKSAVAMARESALNAASQVKNFLKK